MRGVRIPAVSWLWWVVACGPDPSARDGGASTATIGVTSGSTGGVDASSGSTGGAPVEPVEPFALASLCAAKVVELPWNAAPPLGFGLVDGDSRADLVAAVHRDDGWTVSVFAGIEDGFELDPVLGPFEKGTRERLADADADGLVDLLVQGDRLVVHRAAGDGSFDPLDPTTSLSGFRSVDFVDYDGDGVLDLVAADFEDRIAVLGGRGDGAFEPVSSTDVTAHASAIVHTSRSGRPSVGLLTGTAAGCLDCDGSAFSLLQIEPDGTLLPVGALEWGASWSMILPTVTELVGGGTAEVIVELGLDQRSVFGQREGVLEVIGTLPNGPLGFGDLNADGVTELVVAASDGRLQVYDTEAESLTKAATLQVPSGSELFVVDLQGDGIDDVILFDPVGFDPDTGAIQPSLHLIAMGSC